jgi:hypothetical protein
MAIEPVTDDAGAVDRVQGSQRRPIGCRYAGSLSELLEEAVPERQAGPLSNARPEKQDEVACRGVTCEPVRLRQELIVQVGPRSVWIQPASLSLCRCRRCRITGHEHNVEVMTHGGGSQAGKELAGHVTGNLPSTTPAGADNRETEERLRSGVSRSPMRGHLSGSGQELCGAGDVPGDLLTFNRSDVGKPWGG